MREQLDTAEVARMPTEPGPLRRRSGFWRELSGALAVGVALLAAVVVVFQLLAWLRGMPGPGLTMVAGHLLAAALVILVQRFADRLAGWHAALAVVGVTAVSLATLWIFWWA